MKIGDLVRMKTPLTPERYGAGLIQKILKICGSGWARNVYYVLWADGVTSTQYSNEIVLTSEA